MFKKIMSLSVAGLLVVSMVGCNSTVEDTEVTGTSNVVEEQVKEEAKNDMNLVLVDNEVVSIVVTEKYEDNEWGEVGYKATIVNKSDKDLLIGLNDESVNGVVCSPAWATTVPAGKTEYAKIYWWTGAEDTVVKTLADLVNVEFELSITDDESLDRLYTVDITIE